MSVAIFSSEMDFCLLHRDAFQDDIYYDYIYNCNLIILKSTELNVGERLQKV